MYSRPKPDETDEDLLKQQEEFLKNLKENKIKPAAKIVSQKVEETKKDAIEKNAENITKDIQEQLSNTFECVPSNTNIGRIVEKRKIETEDGNFKSLVFNKDSGFPKAKRRDVTITGGSGSIFSQHMKKTVVVKNMGGDHQTHIPMDISENIPAFDFVSSGSNLVKESKILTETDKNEIHERNVNLLKSTPVSEILEEKERLLSTMDPAIVSFLRARRLNQKLKAQNPSITEQNEAGKHIDIDNIKTTSEVLDVPGSEKWLNFNLLETHKLAWMKEIEIAKIDKNKAFEARFDFEGWLLPFSEPEINEKNRALYHHGEEPERPGYTLQELFTLARSSVPQQKILAINSIANILSLYSTGVYQDILDMPIEQIFFLLRFCLDDNTQGVLNASVKAMRCLICNYMDEVCLDCLLGFGFENTLPLLPIDHEKEDDNTINDQQLAERNLIRCLVRTGIYTRIRYIINTIKPSLETVVYCLEILIRLSKDSEFILLEMYKCENLMDSIIVNFIPSSDFHYNHTTAYGTPVLQAVKLVRVLSSRSKQIAKEFVERYNIVDSISKYLQDDTFGNNSNGMKLQMECFHLWRTLLEYNLTLDHCLTLESILLKHMVYHFNHTDISTATTYVREGHCSAVLVLLGKFLTLKPSFISKFENLIHHCVPKWCQQFCQMQSFMCGKSQIISSLIFMAAAVNGYSKVTAVIEENILILLKSERFSEFTRHVQNCSMLLNNYEPHPFSANLKTLQTSAWYTTDHVIPLVQNTSSIPFLSTLSQFIAKSANSEMKLYFLNHINIKTYIQSLENRKSYFLTHHWFTRVESRLIMNILTISTQVQKDVDTSIFYALAVKALCIFNNEQKKDVEFILEKIIFCRNFYPSEALLRNLELNERNENLEISLKNLSEIRLVYSEVLGLKNVGVTEPTLSVDINIGNIIPVDWVYAPILILYSNQQEKKNIISEEQQIFIVKNCLRWILIYETYFPILVIGVNPTDRYCRLACVFLGSDALFLNEEIHRLLELCLANILKKFEDQLDFDKPVQGLKNFQDFYNNMLEQYQAVSYGDILFGNFVLVPLSQKQNVQWRKTLWSEYMGAVQILNIPKEKVITKLDNYLYPKEEDESLLKCYKIALLKNTIRPTSVLHIIAKHHYEEYMRKKVEIKQ